jgi:hypothetical protein
MKTGAALPAVLFAIAMTSALAVGGAYVARQQAAHARLSLQAIQLQPAAEGALATAIAEWDSVARSAQPVGGSEPIGLRPPGTTVLHLWVTRTDSLTYWLVAEAATERTPIMRRRVGVLVLVQGGSVTPASERAWADLP